MRRHIKNGDIILDGRATRYEKEREAFEILEKVEKLFAQRKHRLTDKATYRTISVEDDEGMAYEEPDDIYNLMVALEDIFDIDQDQDEEIENGEEFTIHYE